jgi:hypothetical protein
MICSSALGHAQLVNGRFVTSFYTWQKFDTVNVSKTYLRANQSIQLSVAQKDFSISTYIGGAMNVAGGFGDVGRLRVFNLFAKWANIAQALDLSLGRQAVYAGVGNGTIDGLNARLRLLDDRVIVTGYGGASVKAGLGSIQKDFHDNLNFGGQVLTTLIPEARLGISYMQRREERDPYVALRSRDTTFTPVPYLIQPGSEAEQYLSGDLSYACTNRFSVYGRYDFDVNVSQTSRVQAGARVNVTDAFALTGDYIHRLPRIAFNSIFSVFELNSIDEYEGGVEYGFTPLLRAYGKLAFVNYTDDKSHRWTLGLNAGYGNFNYSGGDGYAGQFQSLSVQGTYPVLDNKVMPSAGISFVSYRLSPDNDSRNWTWAILLGGTVRAVRAFSFDVQGQWLSNRIYKNDARLFVKLNYWFAEHLSIFREEGKQ